MKHYLHITIIHVLHRDRCIVMFLILTFIQIYKVLRRILITNNNFIFSYYILIVQPSFNLVSAKFQPNFRRISDKFQTNFRQISDEFQTNFKRISDNFQTNFRRISDEFQTNFRRISEEFHNLAKLLLKFDQN